ncbi:MAG: DUF481 domain-containing protein [Planctomycetota bacterium]|nr:MAG: DUF481 domain-containing protein [Planctomycetota bacterium]
MILLAVLLMHVSAPTPEAPDIVSPTSMPPTSQEEEEEEEEEEESDKEGRWTGQFTLGASATDGTNTDIKNATVGFDAERKLDKNRWSFGFAWNYSESDGEINQRKTTGKGQYDYFLTEKSYWLATASAGADKETELDLIWTSGVGYGYQFRDDEKWKLSSEVGVNYLSKDFKESEDAEYVTGRLAYDVAYSPSDRWKFSQGAQIFPALQSDGDTDAGDFYAAFDTRIRATVTGAMFAQIQWTLLYDQSPGRNDDGDKLDNDDNLVLLTIGWKF